ncbi:TPA: hypothetical protein ACH3X1_016717 [Trebouxia sp. C0004]
MLPRACEHAVCLVSWLHRCAKRKLEVSREGCVKKHSGIRWGRWCTDAAQAADASFLFKHPLTTFNVMLEEGPKCLFLLACCPNGVSRTLGWLASCRRSRQR